MVGWLYMKIVERDKRGRITKIKPRPKRMCLCCGVNERRVGRKYCSRKCFGLAQKGRVSPNKGKKMSLEARKKMSKSHKGKVAWNKDKKMPQYSKEKHWNWQNGKTKLGVQIRESLEYKKWREEILERDDYTCQKCGKKGNGDLHVDHIVPLAELLAVFKISSIKEAHNCKQVWDIKNGRTLCVECHKKTKSYPKNLRYATVRTHRNSTMREKSEAVSPLQKKE